MTQTVTKIFAGLMLFVFVLTTPINSGDAFAGKHSTKSITKKIEPKGEKHLTVKMDIGAGIIELGRTRMGDIMNAEVEYDPEEIWVALAYDSKKDEGKLNLTSKSMDQGLDLDT